jgi:hypothetical protein
MTKQQGKDLVRAIKTAGKRVVIRHMIRFAILGLIMALALTTLIHIISFFLPIEAVWTLSLATLPLVLVFLIIGWILKPDTKEIALEIDKHGLQEKAITAYELSGREDVYARLQGKDTLDSLKAFNRKKISIKVNKLYYYVIIGLVIALSLLNIIVNPMDDIIRDRKKVQALIDGELDKLHEYIDDIALEEELTQEQKEALKQELDDLAEKLKDLKDYREGLKEFSKTEEKLTEALEQIRKEKLDKLIDLLDDHDITGELADALEDGDSQILDQAIKEIKDKLADQELGDQAKKDLAEALEGLAQGTGSRSLEEKLKSLIESLESGNDVSQIAEGLKEILDSQLETGQGSGDLKYSLQQLRNRLSRAIDDNEKIAHKGDGGKDNKSSGDGQGDGDGDGQGQANGDGQGQDGGDSNGDGNGDGQGQGNGSGQGNGDGQGQSNGSGQGNGDGQGQGNGSGQGNGDGNGQGSGIGSGATGYETIYDPSRLGDGGEESQVPGQNTGQGQIDSKDNMSLGNIDGYIPYGQVISEYEKEAVQSMNRRALPAGIETLVRDYFSSLED